MEEKINIVRRAISSLNEPIEDIEALKKERRKKRNLDAKFIYTPQIRELSPFFSSLPSFPFSPRNAWYSGYLHGQGRRTITAPYCTVYPLLVSLRSKRKKGRGKGGFECERKGMERLQHAHSFFQSPLFFENKN